MQRKIQKLSMVMFSLVFLAQASAATWSRPTAQGELTWRIVGNYPGEIAFQEIVIDKAGNQIIDVPVPIRPNGPFSHWDTSVDDWLSHEKVEQDMIGYLDDNQVFHQIDSNTCTVRITSFDGKPPQAATYTFTISKADNKAGFSCKLTTGLPL